MGCFARDKHYNPKDVEIWLNKVMGPMINELRSDVKEKPKPIKVKIMKASDQNYWYNMFTGHEFEVVTSHDDLWWIIASGYKEPNILLKADCKIIE